MICLEFVVEVVPVYVRDALKLRDLCIVRSLRVKPDRGLEPEYLYIESCVYILVPESFTDILVSSLIFFLARQLLALSLYCVPGLVVLILRVLQLLRVYIYNVGVEGSIPRLKTALYRVVELEDLLAQCVGLCVDGVESLYKVLVDLYKTRGLLIKPTLLLPSAYYQLL
jgi:hypothetical protein